MDAGDHLLADKELGALENRIEAYFRRKRIRNVSELVLEKAHVKALTFIQRINLR